MASTLLPKCLIIDAKDHILGRLASTIAKHLLMGTKVYVLRCERITMAGHFIRWKLKMRSFQRHRANTNPKKGPFHFVAPSRMFYRVVRGMIPHKTCRGKIAMNLLHCFDGVPPRYQFIRKVKVVPAYRHLRLNPNRPFTRLGRLMTEFGWPYGKLIAKMEVRRKGKEKSVKRVRTTINKLKKRSNKNCCK